MLEPLDLETDGHKKHLQCAACRNARNVFISSQETISALAKLRKLDLGLNPAILIHRRCSTYGLYIVQGLHFLSTDKTMAPSGSGHVGRALEVRCIPRRVLNSDRSSHYEDRDTGYNRTDTKNERTEHIFNEVRNIIFLVEHELHDRVISVPPSRDHAQMPPAVHYRSILLEH